MFDIRIEGLHHTYTPPGQPPVEALQGIDLTIEEGEYVAIVGANGSGKTTLARHLNALLLPTAGDVWVGNRNTRDAGAVRDIRATVGMVFQSPADQIVATVVREDVAFGPENRGVPRDELPEVVRSALERVEMWHARDRPPHLLSAGQQQRVAIAGVLALNPRCIVFDEATAMLDPAARRQILDLMDGLHETGLTLITITHDMTEAARAERIIVMHRGHVARDGPPRQIFTTEDLNRFGLTRPLSVDLAHRLQPALPGLPLDLLTPQELVAALAELINGGTT